MATGTSRTVKYNSTPVGSYHQDSTVSVNSSNPTTSVLTFDINAVCTVVSSISTNKSYPFKGTIASNQFTDISYSGSTGSMKPGTSAVKKDIASKTVSITRTTSSQSISATISMKIDTSGKYSGSGNSSVSLSAKVPALPTYTLSFNANGGSGSMSSVSRYHGVATALPSNTFTAPSGYSFAGWATSEANAKAGTIAASNGGSYTITAATTLYAVWRRTITFQSNWGAGLSVYHYYGGTITIPDMPTTEHTKAYEYYWEFDNVYVISGSSTTYAVGSVITPTTTRYDAVWSRELTLTYTANGGSGTPPTASTAYQEMKYDGALTGASFTLKSNTFTRTGYTFNGWSVGAAGGTYTWNPAEDSTTRTTSTAAQWTEITATLTYNNGGHGTAPSSVTMRYTTATNAASALTASGYTFNGWKRSDNNAVIAAGAQVKAANVVPSALTLTAQWLTNITATATNGNATYNGAAHKAKISVSVAGATVEYGTSTSYGYSLTATNANTAYEMSSVSATNVADSKTVYYRVTKSGYTTVTGSTTITISQKKVTLTWGTLTWTYDKSAHSTTCTAGSLISGDSCTVTLTGNSVGANVGTATVTASSLSNGNYKLPSSKTATLSITQREVTLSWGTVSWTYDGSAHSTTCTAGNVVSGDTCTVTLTGNSVGKNVGTATVTASSLSNSNYKLPSTKTKTLSVNQREVTFTWGTTSWVYDGNTHSTTCTAGNLVSGDTCTVTLTGNSVGANVGSATVTASSLSNSNYKLPSAKTKTISVTAASSSFTLSPTSLTLTYPTAGTSTFSGINCSINTVTSSSTSIATVSKSGNTITVTPVAAGTATITVTGTASSTNYSAPANKTISITVNRASQTVTLSATSGTITYPSTTITFTASTSGNGALSVSPTSGNTVANASISSGTVTVTRAGYGSTTITVTAAQTNQYNSASKTYTITTSKRTVTPTAPTLTTGTLTYNGSAKTLANAGSCTTGGTMYYYVGTSSIAPTFSTSTYKTSIDTKTDAGTYYVFWYCYVSDTTNNNDTSSDNINVAKSLGSRVIDKAANPITYANQTWAYTFATSAQTKTLSAATNAQGTVTYSLQSQKQGSTAVTYFTFNTSTRVLTGAASTPVNTYTVVVRASAAGNSNYNSGTADSTITVTISRASVGAKPTTSVSKLYNLSEQTNNYTTPSYVTMTGNNKGTNVGTYTATYTPDSNHSWSDGTYAAVTVTLTIWAPGLYIRQSNAWKKTIPIIRVSGAWKVPSAVYVRVGGAWKQVNRY